MTSHKLHDSQTSGTGALAGGAYFRAVWRLDAAQTMGLWMATAAAFLLRLFGPDIGDIQVVLVVLASWLIGTELLLFVKCDDFVLRGKTAIIIGFFGFIFLSPTLGSLARLGAPEKGASTAVAACLLYMATTMTVYSAVPEIRRSRVDFLERFVVDIDNRALIRMVLICFLPTIILRAILQDWSKVSGIIPGLLGIGSQPWAHKGFGDVKVVFFPINWLYALAPAFSAVCWVKCRNMRGARVMVAAVWTFIFPALMLQRSRALLVSTVVLILAVMLLLEPDKRRRNKVYVIFLALVPILTILSNLLLIDRGTGYVARQFLETGRIEEETRLDPRTMLEDNLYFFARTAEVVPDRIPHRSPKELYFYLAINPIPRFLWPGKPWMSQEYLGKIRPYYAAITIVGDFYVYGGWWHIVFGGIVFGFLLRRVDQFGKAVPNPETGRVILYAFLILALFGSVRALWNLVVSVYAVVTLLFILMLVKRRQAVASVRSRPFTSA